VIQRVFFGLHSYQLPNVEWLEALKRFNLLLHQLSSLEEEHRKTVEWGVELVGHVKDMVELKDCVPDTPMVVDILAVDEPAVIDVLCQLRRDFLHH
jgi:hypothetical protein